MFASGVSYVYGYKAIQGSTLLSLMVKLLLYNRFKAKAEIFIHNEGKDVNSYSYYSRS